MNKEQACCFIGHRSIAETPELENLLITTITSLIVNEAVDTFFFGSQGQFNNLCKKVLAELKKRYPHITRIYVRAEYEHISERYRAYLLQTCEDTYFPKRITGAGKAVYVERNCEMIDQSRYCIVYFNHDYMPPKRKRSKKELFARQTPSGTQRAYDYAVKKGCIIKNLFNEL